MKTIRSLSSKKTPPICTLMSNGGFSTGRPTALKPNQLGMNNASAVEELRDADRRHGEHEPGCPAEPVDDRPFDDEAEEHGRDQTDDEGDGVGEPRHPVRRATRCVLGNEQDREDRRNCAEIALREVDDAIRAVHERDADREQRGERADQRALDDDAERRAEEDVGDVDQHEGRDRERQDAQAVLGGAVEHDEADCRTTRHSSCSVR